MLRRKLWMIDDHSLCIMHMLWGEIFEFIREINQEGITILLVEQNVQDALALAHPGYAAKTD